MVFVPFCNIDFFIFLNHTKIKIITFEANPTQKGMCMSFTPSVRHSVKTGSYCSHSILYGGVLRVVCTMNMKPYPTEQHLFFFLLTRNCRIEPGSVFKLSKKCPSFYSQKKIIEVCGSDSP